MSIKQLTKDSAIYGGADFISKIVSFFTFPFIARALNPESFGFVELIMTSTALIAVVGNVGLNNSVQRFFWDPEVNSLDRSKLVSSGLFSLVGLFLILVFLILSVILIFYPGIGSAYNFSFFGLFSALVLMMGNQWTQYLLDILRLQFKAIQYLTVSIVSRVCSALFGMIAVVSFQGGIDGLLAAQALVVFMVLPLAYYFVRDEISISNISLNWTKELIKFGFPFIFTSLAFWVFTSQDRWMLASLATVEEVGIYSVSFRFASVLMFVSAAFGQAWSPFAMKLRVDMPTEYRSIYGDVLLILVFVMGFIGAFIAFFSGEMLQFLVGEKYLDSGLSLIVLVFAIVFQSTQQITGIGISIEKKTKIFTYLSSITALINFGLNYFLIPVYGSFGASIATLISYIFLSGGYLFFTQRLHPLILNLKKLYFFISLLFSFLFISIYLFVPKLELLSILFKLVILILFLSIGLFMIPFKRIKYV